MAPKEKIQRRLSDARKVADSIERALEEIGAMKLRDRDKLFVKPERVMRRRSQEPTELQFELYEWIRKRDGGMIRWELSLGMHYGRLGGLMARGLIREVEQEGVRYIKIMEP